MLTHRVHNMYLFSRSQYISNALGLTAGVIPKDFHLKRASTRVAPPLHILNNKQDFSYVYLCKTSIYIRRFAIYSFVRLWRHLHLCNQSSPPTEYQSVHLNFLKDVRKKLLSTIRPPFYYQMRKKTYSSSSSYLLISKNNNVKKPSKI